MNEELKVYIATIDSMITMSNAKLFDALMEQKATIYLNGHVDYALSDPNMYIIDRFLHDEYKNVKLCFGEGILGNRFPPCDLDWERIEFPNMYDEDDKHDIVHGPLETDNPWNMYCPLKDCDICILLIDALGRCQMNMIDTAVKKYGKPIHVFYVNKRNNANLNFCIVPGHFGDIRIGLYKSAEMLFQKYLNIASSVLHDHPTILLPRDFSEFEGDVLSTVQI